MAIKPQPSFNACQHNTKKPVFEMVNVVLKSWQLSERGGKCKPSMPPSLLNLICQTTALSILGREVVIFTLNLLFDLLKGNN